MQADSFRSEKKKNFWISLMNARRKKYEPAFSVDVNHKTTKKLIHIFPSSPNNSNRKKEERSNEATMKTSARRGLSNCVRCEKRKKKYKTAASISSACSVGRQAGGRESTADTNHRIIIMWWVSEQGSVIYQKWNHKIINKLSTASKSLAHWTEQSEISLCPLFTVEYCYVTPLLHLGCVCSIAIFFLLLH